MRPLTILRSTSQDDIKALYHTTYSKAKYKDVGVLVKGVNDNTEFSNSSQDEVKAHYGLDVLIKSANNSKVLVSGINDEIKVVTKALLKTGIVVEEVVTIPRAEIENIQETIFKLDDVVENVSFSWKFF